MRQNPKRIQKNFDSCLKPLLIAFFALASLIYLGVFLWGAWAYSFERLLPQEGVQAEAIVTRHYIEGKSKENWRIDYKMLLDGNEYHRTGVAPTKELRDSIDVGSRLPVVYLPNTPSVSRLLEKERGIGDASGYMIMGALGLILFGSMFLYCVFKIPSSNDEKA